MMMDMCLPKRERRWLGEGDGMPTAAQAPRRRPAPTAPSLFPPSSLSLLGYVEEPSPLKMAAKGEANSQLWVVPPKIGLPVNI
jgi:hypothetical protein